MPYRNTYVNIYINNIIHNFDVLQKKIGNSMLFPVIKADAYGHGMLEVSRALQTRAKCFCVATVDEALELRAAGIKNCIMVLGLSQKSSFKAAVENNIILSLEDEESIVALNDVAQSFSKITLVQLAINTGMNRIGINSIDKFKSILELIKNLSHIKLAYVFSHFASADNGDDLDSYSKNQIKLFQDYINLLPNDCIISMENSAAMLKLKNHYTACRIGIALYGYSPIKNNLDLRPAMEWHSKIVAIHHFKKGESIGYSCNYVLDRDSIIGVVPIGYADGYKRCLSNKARVIVSNNYANVVGNVCMDQIMIDISDIPNVELGQDVILMGNNKNLNVDAEELAKLSDTISYEILCSPSKRFEKIYTY